MLEEHLLPKAAMLERIARESKLVQRRSQKFNASGFLVSLLKAVVKGDTSLNHLVMHLSGFANQPMSRQAIHQRFGPATSSFLLGVMRHMLSRRFPQADAILRSGRFGRVIVEDSTVVSMAKSNAANFPNNGNGRDMTAGCKCLLVADLISGKPIDFQLHAAREADQALAFESVPLCRSGDLIIRDMGFFCLEALEQIGRRNAFWISRLPASVSSRTPAGKNLDKLLADGSQDMIDLPVLIGRDGLPCRLIALRLERQRAAANRRHLRAEAKRRRSTPKRESLQRAGWRILVTNLDAASLSAKAVSDLYALRWSIEIKFRAFKQSCKLSHGLKHRSGFHHIEAMVLAAMIYQLLTLRIHAVLARKRAFEGCLSIEKTSDSISIYLLGIRSDPLTWIYNPDPRHIRYGPRKRLNHWQSIIQSLA